MQINSLGEEGPSIKYDVLGTSTRLGSGWLLRSIEFGPTLFLSLRFKHQQMRRRGASLSVRSIYRNNTRLRTLIFITWPSRCALVISYCGRPRAFVSYRKTWRPNLSTYLRVCWQMWHAIEKRCIPWTGVFDTCWVLFVDVRHLVGIQWVKPAKVLFTAVIINGDIRIDGRPSESADPHGIGHLTVRHCFWTFMVLVFRRF